jgi:hypothetical protein
MRTRPLALLFLAGLSATVPSKSALAAKAHCRDVVFAGAAGLASNDKVVVRVTDAAGAPVESSGQLQVNPSESAKDFAARLVAAWGDGSSGTVGVCPNQNPTPPLPKTSCGTQPLGTRSCKHKYKFKPDRSTVDPNDGLIRIRICCKDGTQCRGPNMVSPKTPVTVQSRIDPSLVFIPDVPPEAGPSFQGISLDPIDMIQLPAGEMQGCRKGLGQAARQLADGTLTLLVKGLPPDPDPAAQIAPATAACAAEGVKALALGFGTCPSPCAAIVTSQCTAGQVGAPCGTYAECDLTPGDGVCTTDWNLVTDCLTCQIQSAVTTAYDEAYGTGTSGSAEADDCQFGIGRALLDLIGRNVNETLRCQRLLDVGSAGLPPNPAGQCTVPTCTAPPLKVGAPCSQDVDCNVPPTCKRADLVGARLEVAARAGDRIAHDCNDMVIAAELDTCDVDVPGTVTCVTAAGEAAARAIADAVFTEGRASP